MPLSFLPISPGSISRREQVVKDRQGQVAPLTVGEKNFGIGAFGFILAFGFLNLGFFGAIVVHS
jgi:hypothetical protein